MAQINLEADTAEELGNRIDQDPPPLASDVDSIFVPSMYSTFRLMKPLEERRSTEGLDEGWTEPGDFTGLKGSQRSPVLSPAICI